MTIGSHAGRHHGPLPDTRADSLLLICSDPSLGRDSIATTEVNGLLPRLAGLAKG